MTEPALLTRLGQRAEVAGYRAAWRLVRRLPERSAYRIFELAADQVWRRDGRSVHRLRANYARVRPELDEAALEELVRAGCRSYLRYWCDAFRLSLRSPAELDRRMRLTGADAIAWDLVTRRQPLVCFLGHLGNWDTAGAWSTSHFGHVTTVAERLEPEEVFAEFLEFRTSLGMTILPLTGGPDPYPALVEALRGDGGFVPLLADRDLTSRGVQVDLLGHAVRVATGPARLALDTGATLMALALHYELAPDGGHRVVATFSEPVQPPAGVGRAEQVRAMTQACVDHLGTVIAAHTQDWHMMQRVFVADLS